MLGKMFRKISFRTTRRHRCPRRRYRYRRGHRIFFTLTTIASPSHINLGQVHPLLFIIVRGRFLQIIPRHIALHKHHRIFHALIFASALQHRVSRRKRFIVHGLSLYLDQLIARCQLGFLQQILVIVDVQNVRHNIVIALVIFGKRDIGAKCAIKGQFHRTQLDARDTERDRVRLLTLTILDEIFLNLGECMVRHIRRVEFLNRGLLDDATRR
mmetsp:Transcript_15486/g.23626  ORF Transcript_15486/g.23626 Transcript_15486/m.23626 type:complete len:213 (-) Transcript_15486:797-1435(-)